MYSEDKFQLEKYIHLLLHHNYELLHHSWQVRIEALAPLNSLDIFYELSIYLGRITIKSKIIITFFNLKKRIIFVLKGY